MSFSDKLAAAKAAPRKHEDVDVLLDGDLAEMRADLQASLDDVKRRSDGDQRLAGGADPEAADLQDKLDALIAESRDSIVTLRFFRLPGEAWANIQSHCPARLGVPMESDPTFGYGYNMQQAAKLAAAYTDQQGQIFAGRVEGDEVLPLRYVAPTKDNAGINEWDDLFSVISGAEQSRIESAVYSLNVAEPATNLLALKKKLGLPLD